MLAPTVQVWVGRVSKGLGFSWGVGVCFDLDDFRKDDCELLQLSWYSIPGGSEISRSGSCLLFVSGVSGSSKLPYLKAWVLICPNDAIDWHVQSLAKHRVANKWNQLHLEVGSVCKWVSSIFSSMPCCGQGLLALHMGVPFARSIVLYRPWFCWYTRTYMHPFE